MIVEDIYRILNTEQDIDIYNPVTRVFVFTGKCKDITLSCMGLSVSQIFTNNDVLVVITK